MSSEHQEDFMVMDPTVNDDEEEALRGGKGVTDKQAIPMSWATNVGGLHNVEPSQGQQQFEDDEDTCLPSGSFAEAGMLVLPDELLLHVLSFVPCLADAARAFTACHRLRSLHREDLFWRAMSAKRWGAHLLRSVGVSVSWHDYFREKIALSRPGSVEWSAQYLSSRVPTRFTHTGTVIGNKIYYIGGQMNVHGPRLQEVIEYDTVNGDMHKIKVTGDIPMFARHSAVELNSKIWIFGGYDGIGSFFDLAIFDPANLTWTYPKVNGDIPVPRSNHSAAVVGKKIYIFGGSTSYDEVYTIIGDFYELDTDTMTWTRLDTQITCPSPRVGHRMISLGNRVFMFGGGVWSSEAGWQQKINDLCIYDTDAKKWTTLSSQSNPAVCSYPFIFARGYHIFLFGGQSLHDVAVTNSLYAFDTVNLSWTQMESPLVEGFLPSPRDMGCANVVDDRCFLYGGYSGGPLSEGAGDLWVLKFRSISNASKDVASSTPVA